MTICAAISSILFIGLAITFATGKGNKYIAGYNTVNEEERCKINIYKLRLLMSVMMIITVAYLSSLLIFITDILTQLISTGIYLLSVIIFMILANTWTKKRKTELQEYRKTYISYTKIILEH